MIYISIILFIIITLTVASAIRDIMIMSFKISYYEETFRLNGIDVSHIHNITLRKIFRLSNET